MLHSCLYLVHQETKMRKGSRPFRFTLQDCCICIKISLGREEHPLAPGYYFPQLHLVMTQKRYCKMD